MSGEGDRQVLSVRYDELSEAQKDENVLIIDVREQDEINETGKLPGSIHIPMGQVSKTLTSLSDETFEEKFGKRKPNKGTKIILSCRSGKRSSMVQDELQKLGYEKCVPTLVLHPQTKNGRNIGRDTSINLQHFYSSYNYIGGWLDWESKQKV